MNDNSKSNIFKFVDPKRLECAKKYLRYSLKLRDHAKVDFMNVVELVLAYGMCAMFGWSFTASTCIGILCASYLCNRGLAYWIERMSLDILKGKFTPTELKK